MKIINMSVISTVYRMLFVLYMNYKNVQRQHVIWLRSSILGAHNNASVANTRPFILYTKTGEPFEAFAPSSSLTSHRSPIFRVESIDDDDCAVLRVLTVVLGDGTAVPPGDDPICTF